MIDLLLRIGATKLAVSIALAALALVVQRRFDRPMVSHTLWVLVLCALVIPAVVTIPLPGLDSAASLAGAGSGLGGPDNEALAAPVSPEVLARLKAGVVVLWLMGAVILLIWSLARTVRFHRLLAAGSEPAPAVLQRMASEIAVVIGLIDVPVIRVMRAQLSPMVWWTGGKVRVLVPAALLDDVDDDELRCIIAHEMAHVRRRDHVTRWLEWLACAVFWWNPVAWLARRELRAAEEFCCDAVVLAALSPGARAYGNSLVTVIDFLSSPVTLRVPAFASEADSGGQMKLIERRLRRIMTRDTTHVVSPRLRAGLLAAAVLLLPLGLVYCGPETVAPEADAGSGQATFVAREVDAATAKGKLYRMQEAEARAAAESFDAWGTAPEPVRAEYRKGEPGDELTKVEEGSRFGRITPAAGRDQAGLLKKKKEAGGNLPFGVSPEAELQAMELKVRAAVENGNITAEEGRMKLEELSRRRIR